MKIETKSRIIDSQEGLYFYERDIVMLSALYLENTEIVMKFKQVQPGIGIIYSQPAGNQYALRISDGWAYVSKNGTENIVNTSTNIFSGEEEITLVFCKRGRILSVETVEKDILLYADMQENMDEYNIGIYSSAKNTINSLNIKTGIPYHWFFNINNSPGGRIGFYRDGFLIENCPEIAELEHQKIDLKAGKYFLDFKATGDIVPYLFHSSDERIDINKKNILGKNRWFELEKDAQVNLAFRGKNGTIERIAIKLNEEDPYVSSREKAIKTSGSYIKIDTTRIKKVFAEGKITSVPETGDEYGILKSENNFLRPEYYDIKNNKLFSAEIDTEEKTIILNQEKEKIINYLHDKESDKYIKLFVNMNALLTQLIATYDDGTEIDIILRSTTVKYLPDSITSPIIAVDRNSNPLDISSSYRCYENEEGEIIYRFTNWEREYFLKDESIKLSKRIRGDSLDYVKVYGIKEKDFNNYDLLLMNKEKEIDDIDAATKEYDVLYPDPILSSALNRIIEIDTKEEYEIIVVDYLKENSYCINHLPEQGLYEINFSTAEDEIELIYDHTDEETGMTIDHIITEFETDVSKYIVLSQEV